MTLKEIKQIYEEVHKDFPEVKLTSYNVGYNKDVFIQACLSYEGVKKGIFPLQIDDDFVALPKEDKAAAIAHEIGHLKRLQGKDDETIKEEIKIADQANFIYDMDVRKHYPEDIKNNEWIMEVLKWSILDEMYADTAAAERGYGESILKILREDYDQLKDHPNLKNHPFLNLPKSRIENLEALLE